MIKYKLKCNDCKEVFDSWFSSSKEFEKIKKIKLLSCHKCNSLNVDKSLMAPNVINKIPNEGNNKKFKEIKSKLKEYQKFVKVCLIDLTSQQDTLYHQLEFGLVFSKLQIFHF